MENNSIDNETILIFKTSVNHKKDIRRVAAVLDSVSGILRWTIDISDIDKVLRIEATTCNPTDVIMTIQQTGYHCEELKD